MRIHSFSAVIAISSILAACGEKDANSTANTEESSPDGITTYSPVDLWTPAAIGDTRTLKARIDQGADINALLPEGGMTALAIAADFGQNDAVKMLLKAGADPDARNENQSTPSLGAAFFGRPDCLKTLLDAGADPNLADENGTTTFTALAIPWELTKGIADLMQMPLDQGTLEIGREKCWQILGPMTDIWTAAATGEISAIKARIAEHFTSLDASRLPEGMAEQKGEWWYRDFVQRAGETVFVPSMWHHAVINLDDTVAVSHGHTQYISSDSAVWR